MKICLAAALLLFNFISNADLYWMVLVGSLPIFFKSSLSSKAISNISITFSQRFRKDWFIYVEMGYSSSNFKKLEKDIYFYL